MNYSKKLSIRQWAEDDKPREKLLSKGNSSLSDAELLALLLKSGNRNFTAVDLAMSILRSSNNDLSTLARLSVGELMKIRGIGPAKASAVAAAMELGRRRNQLIIKKKEKISSSKHAFALMKYDFFDLEIEEFWILVLNRSNSVIDKKRISQGGVSGTVADNKLIFKYVLQSLGSSLIVAHNHPSGNLKPSRSDEQLTSKIKSACQNLDIQLLDHLIIHNDDYFSFADDGLL